MAMEIVKQMLTYTLSDESVVDVNCCNGDVNIVEESVK